MTKTVAIKELQHTTSNLSLLIERCESSASKGLCRSTCAQCKIEHSINALNEKARELMELSGGKL